MAMVEFFNRIALLVASEILAESNPAARARVIARVIQVQWAIVGGGGGGGGGGVSVATQLALCSATLVFGAPVYGH